MISIDSRQFLRLLLRSPDLGDGWRRVSKMVWPLVEEFTEQDLIEKLESDEGGGNVRLSQKGQAVIEYVV
jgi:hypothetical protein